MKCSHCQQLIPDQSKSCPHCQAVFELNPKSDSNPFSPPAAKAAEPPMAALVQSEGDATGGLIPYKNPKALLAYYLGIASGLPLIGLPFGMTAFVLGILGLKDRKKNPAIKGSAHAWIGIGCGGLFTLFWTLLIIAIIIGIANS